jgi:hypothetical protein
LRYSFLQDFSDFKLFKHETRFFAGGSASTFYSKSNYYYLDKYYNMYFTSVWTWYWSHSIDLVLQLEYKIDEGRFLIINLDLPVISNVSRPKYSPSADYSYSDNDWKIKAFGNTEFFWKNFEPNFSILYQTPLIENINFLFSYEFTYARYDKPDPVRQYMNDLRFGIQYGF